MLFKYKGYNLDGEIISGYLHASNKREALNKLKYGNSIIALFYIKVKIDNRYINKVRNSYDKTIVKVNDNFISKLKEEKSLISEKKKQKKEKEKKKNNFFDLSTSPVLSKVLSKNKLSKDNDDIYSEEKEGSNPFESNGDIVITKAKLSELIKRDFNKDKEIDWGLIGEDIDDKTLKRNKKIKVKEKEIILFTKRLSMMLASGVSLMRALDVLNDSSSKKMKKVIEGVISSIQGGNSLSNSLAKYPNQFDQTYVSLIAIGEMSGSLEQCLNDIIYYKEKSIKIKKKVKTASIYPSIIGLLLVAVLVLGSIFFIPMFEDMFTEQGMALPGITQMVFKIAKRVPYTVAIIIIIVIIISTFRKKSKKFDLSLKMLSDLQILNIPVIKNVLNSSYMFTFSLTVSLMLRNGIKISDALMLAQKAINNIYIKSEISMTSQLMMHGLSLSESLSKQPHFDNLLVSVALTGEESGKMAESLKDDEELNKYVDNLMELIQPLSIGTIGIIAIPIIIAIYLPILDISSGASLGL